MLNDRKNPQTSTKRYNANSIVNEAFIFINTRNQLELN